MNAIISHLSSLTARIAVTLPASFIVITLALTAVQPAWSQNETKSGRQAYKVGDGVTAPKVLSKTDPEYTPDAKDAHIEGTVILRCVITSEGVADDITVVQGINPGLDQKAMEAIAKWTFQPGTKDGQPVDVYATIEVNFRVK